MLNDMQSMDELGHFQLSGFVYRSLRHGAMHQVMAVDEWHNNGPQERVTMSLRIQIAIEKMKLCSLSVVYACPYNNPTATI
jgi:hypothetical protein